MATDNKPDKPAQHVQEVIIIDTPPRPTVEHVGRTRSPLRTISKNAKTYWTKAPSDATPVDINLPCECRPDSPKSSSRASRPLEEETVLSAPQGTNASCRPGLRTSFASSALTSSIVELEPPLLLALGDHKSSKCSSFRFFSSKRSIASATSLPCQVPCDSLGELLRPICTLPKFQRSVGCGAGGGHPPPRRKSPAHSVQSCSPCLATLPHCAVHWQMRQAHHTLPSGISRVVTSAGRHPQGQTHVCPRRSRRPSL